MKTKIYATALLAFIIQVMVQSQTPANQTTEYSFEYWKGYANKQNWNTAEKEEFLKAKQYDLNRKPTSVINSGANQKPALNNSSKVQSAPPGCNNIDFEAGSTTGWTLSSGFHPIYNAQGCCLNPGGQQLITTATNATFLDPFGGFPFVAPGGNFSLRIGDNNVNGQADRVEQTFFVTAANANFTYKYAVVFEDPGHTAAQQPAFVVEMFDTTNTAIPCTYYNVSAGQNIPGFLNGPGNVVYKPWTNVVVDLTNYIGQNVTIRFTTYDCALGGHFGYAYIDGVCAAFTTGNSLTMCAGASSVICAPTGFGSYTWNGPNTNNVQSQCLNVSASGIYSCSTTMVTNCQGPTFTYTVTNYPVPNVSFNPQSTSPCALNYNFINNSSVSSGNISSYTWTLGNNTTSNLTNPSANYPTYGTYNVSLTATSNFGCTNTGVNTLTIYPPPAPSFVGNNVCQSSLITFTNTSSIPTGSIVSYSWNLANLQNSTLTHPSTQYTSPGPRTVTLTATSNLGCSASYTGIVNVNPLPAVNFTGSDVCFGQANNFTNLSNISSGNITNYVWNFNGFNTSTAINPNYTFPNNGSYNVQLTAVSDMNCVNNIIKQVLVHAIPVADFTILNGCAMNQLNITNNSSVQNATLSTFLWTFGQNAAAFVHTPTYFYPSPGNYTVSLMVYSNYSCSAQQTKTVTVFAVPQVGFQSNVACLNQTTQFNNSTIISSGFVAKWRWDFQNDGIWDDTTSVSPSLIYPNYGNYNCKLMAVSNNGCPSNVTNPVVVHLNPVANFKSSPTCLGDRTEFTNLSSSPSGNITCYAWQYYGDGNVNNVYSYAAHNYPANGVYLVKLEVQNEYGCTNVMAKSVYVNPKPVPTFTMSDPKGCERVCVTFTNQSTISTGNISTYQWLFGDGSKPEYTKNPTHCYNVGIYDVTLKLVSDSGCMATYINQKAIEVHPKPIASFVAEPNEIDELEPISNITSDAVGADEVKYYINDGGIYLVNNFTHNFNNLDKQQPVIFQIVSNKFGCKDTTSRVLKLKQSYAIYIPNTFTPNYDGTNDGFKAKGYNIVEFHITIYDRWGHKVFESDDMDVAWDGHTKDSSEPIKDDVYVWKANVVDINKKAHDLVGHVTLLK
jgi:gliding motility-associated-like protein